MQGSDDMARWSGGAWVLAPFDLRATANAAAAGGSASGSRFVVCNLRVSDGMAVGVLLGPGAAERCTKFGVRSPLTHGAFYGWDSAASLLPESFLAMPAAASASASGTAGAGGEGLPSAAPAPIPPLARHAGNLLLGRRSATALAVSTAVERGPAVSATAMVVVHGSHWEPLSSALQQQQQSLPRNSSHGSMPGVAAASGGAGSRNLPHPQQAQRNGGGGGGDAPAVNNVNINAHGAGNVLRRALSGGVEGARDAAQYAATGGGGGGGGSGSAAAAAVPLQLFDGQHDVVLAVCAKTSKLSLYRWVRSRHGSPRGPAAAVCRKATAGWVVHATPAHAPPDGGLRAHAPAPAPATG